MSKRCERVRLRRVRASALIAVLGCVLALAGAAIGAGSTPQCATSSLRLDRIGGQGFTSHQEWDFALRNVSPKTCHLKGYPRVVLLDKGARPISVHVDHHPGAQQTVVLHAWQRAFVSFVYVVSGPCIPHFFSAYGLALFPPGSGQRLVFYKGRFDVCSPSVGGNPTVSPVLPKLGP
jgi:Protein of unknown function (DUF4232)